MKHLFVVIYFSYLLQLKRTFLLRFWSLIYTSFYILMISIVEEEKCN